MHHEPNPPQPISSMKILITVDGSPKAKELVAYLKDHFGQPASRSKMGTKLFQLEWEGDQKKIRSMAVLMDGFEQFGYTLDK